MTNASAKNVFKFLPVMFVSLALSVGAFAGSAHAQAYNGGYDLTGSGGSGSYSPDTFGSYSPDTTGSYSPDTYGAYSPDTYGSYSPDTYSTYSPSTYSTYSTTPSYSTYSPYSTTPSYSTYSSAPSYSSASPYFSSIPSFSSAAPAYSTPSSQKQQQSSYNSNPNTNVNNNNNIITINTPTPAPAPVYPQPIYNAPVCSLTVNNYNSTYPYNYSNQPVTLMWTSSNATSGWITNGVGTVGLNGSITVNPAVTTTYTATFTGYHGQTTTCSATVNRAPIVYNPAPVVPAQPYVSLTQVPYTGLDLGFWGTIAYWGCLIHWCLAAAYLIVIRRVQNRVVYSMKNFLFGADENELTPAIAGSNGMLSQTDLQALAAMLRSNFEPAQAESAPVAHVFNNDSQEDKTDEFILAQINRNTR